MPGSNPKHPFYVTNVGSGGQPPSPSNPLPVSANDAESVRNAPDAQQSITYLDAGTADQRIQKITTVSATLGKTLIETFTYAGSAGNYYMTGSGRSVS